jgi:hypothetical protein
MRSFNREVVIFIVWLRPSAIAIFCVMTCPCDVAFMKRSSAVVADGSSAPVSTGSGPTLGELDSGQSRACNNDILFHASPTGSDGAYHSIVNHYWDPAAENYDSAMVRRVEAKTLRPALRELRESLGRHVERPRSPGFVDRNIHTAEPCAVHAHMCYQTTTRIDHGDVVWDFKFDRLAFACGNGLSCIVEG